MSPLINYLGAQINKSDITLRERELTVSLVLTLKGLTLTSVTEVICLIGVFNTFQDEIGAFLYGTNLHFSVRRFCAKNNRLRTLLFYHNRFQRKQCLCPALPQFTTLPVVSYPIISPSCNIYARCLGHMYINHTHARNKIDGLDHRNNSS